MRYACIALLGASTLAMAGIWSPPIFTPVTLPDGTQTWSLQIDIGDLAKTDRKHPDAERDTRVAAQFLGMHKMCADGWEIEHSELRKRWLYIKGRCL